MGNRKRMKTRYRRFPWLTDIAGIKSSIGEMRGLGHPKQPAFNRRALLQEGALGLDEQWFRETIAGKVARHRDNGMEFPFYGEPIFDTPLVGFVHGDDPIFGDLKEIIGPHHFTPEEIMRWQAKKAGLPSPAAADLSVVSFVLPITKVTKSDNATMADWPSERWAQTRLLGEIFSQAIVREIVTSLMGHGILAVSPDVTPMFNKKRYPRVGWASPWSHRHIAYAAGLGTFGMHDFLITEKGCSHRLGSFVVDLKLGPDRPRPDDIHAHCLQYQGVHCLRCAARCPVAAVTVDAAHDKEACYRRVASSLKHCIRSHHLFIYGCGLCATGVPCESGIPSGLTDGPGTP